MGILTDIDVANAALAAIGEDPVQDLDDDTFGAAQVGLAYQETVEFNLGLEPFSFGREIRQLSQVTGATPSSGYLYIYDLPSDRIGPPVYVTDDVTDPDRRFNRYALISGQVHADPTALFAMIKFRPGPERWSATFKSATITALASKFALSFASDKETSDILHRRAYGSPQENFRGGQMRAAISEDALATPPRKPDWNNNPLERAWRSGSSAGIGSYPGDY